MTTNLRVLTVPRLCELNPGICLTTEEKARKNLSQGVRNCREFCRKWRLPRHFWVISHAVNLRHGTDSFTSLSEGRRAEDFFRPKIPTASAGFEPANLGTKG